MFLSENVGTVDLCITLCRLNASKYIIFLFNFHIYFIFYKGKIMVIYLPENVGTMDLCNILQSLNAS